MKIQEQLTHEMEKAKGEAMKTISIEARELQLYIENDSTLYTQQTVCIQRNLSRKHKKGTYDHSLAPKLWKYLADNGAKKYTREFVLKDNYKENSFGVFTPDLRREAAQSMADDYLMELEAGNYTN